MNTCYCFKRMTHVLVILVVQFNRVKYHEFNSVFTNLVSMLSNIKSHPNFNKTVQQKRFLSTPLFATRCLITIKIRSNVMLESHCTTNDRNVFHHGALKLTQIVVFQTLKNWQINQRTCCILPLSLVCKNVFKFE